MSCDAQLAAGEAVVRRGFVWGELFGVGNVCGDFQEVWDGIIHGISG